MSDLLEKMSSIKTNKVYSNGMVSIGFRQDQAVYDINKNNFELNFSDNDGWFRKNYGIAKGYGLCINEIKITSAKPVYAGDFSCYKCKIKFTDCDFEGTEKSDLFWLYIHKELDIIKVLHYIDITKENWKP